MLSGQYSQPECEKTPIKDRLEEATVQEIVRTHDDKQKVCFFKVCNVFKVSGDV